MKRLIYILICVFFSCNSAVEKPKKPENLISEEKMVDIMYDVFLLNSAKGVNKKLLELNGVFPEQYVFEKYKIDSTQFANSNNYYAYDTKTYESILNRIKEKIDLKKKEFEALEKVEEAERIRKADSIKEVRAKERDSLVKYDKIELKKPKGIN
jgi:hypothetical protein